MMHGSNIKRLNHYLTALGAICSSSCEHSDKCRQPVRCLIQYPSSSLSCSAVTKLILDISADIDTTQHMWREPRVRILITIIITYRTGGRVVSLVQPRFSWNCNNSSELYTKTVQFSNTGWGRTWVMNHSSGSTSQKLHNAFITNTNTNTNKTLLYVLTYLLTPHSTVNLEKLTVLQLVKKFPAFYGTRRSLTAFTSASHLSLS
jgi:hypothetical protein